MNLADTDILRPIVGDPVVLPPDGMTEVRSLSGFTWPTGSPEPTGFRIVDPAGLEYDVVLANRDLRIWTADRRSR